MSKPQNRIKLDGSLDDIEIGKNITKFWLRVEGIGAGGITDEIECVAFGAEARHLSNDLDTLNFGDSVRVTGGLRISEGQPMVLATAVKPIYHREETE